MKRVVFALVVLLIVVGVAVSATDALAQKPQAAKGKPGGGGGGKGGGADPLYLLKLTIDDNFVFTDLTETEVPTQLLSDGKQRTLADGDSDGFLELIGSMDPDFLVSYQDYRVAVEAMNTNPDPCAQLELSTSSSPGRTTLQLNRLSHDFDATNLRCDLSTVPPYVDDARTFTLVFDKNDTVDPNTGGSCACDKLSYLDGIPGARTMFAEVENSCTLGIAAVEIRPLDMTGGPKIIAWPFEDLHNSKKNRNKARQSVAGKTTVNISFDTDALEIGEQTLWGLSSQGEIIKTETVGGDDNIRVITAEADPFTLNGPDQLFGGSGQCTNVSMTFQITVQRFDMNAAQ